MGGMDHATRSRGSLRNKIANGITDGYSPLSEVKKLDYV